MIDSSKLILKYNTESIEISFPNNYEELIKIFKAIKSNFILVLLMKMMMQ